MNNKKKKKNFLCNVANRETIRQQESHRIRQKDKQSNATENIISLAETIIISLTLYFAVVAICTKD